MFCESLSVPCHINKRLPIFDRTLVEDCISSLLDFKFNLGGTIKLNEL